MKKCSPRILLSVYTLKCSVDQQKFKFNLFGQQSKNCESIRHNCSVCSEQDVHSEREQDATWTFTSGCDGGADVIRRPWQLAPGLLPGKPLQRSLAGYSPRGRREEHTAEGLSAAPRRRWRINFLLVV